jgi:hypothetical protein
MAMAAAMKGKGSDTAARNQTNFAGMNGISHNTSRWNANSAQATRAGLAISDRVDGERIFQGKV